jgi:hypothetical protein
MKRVARSTVRRIYWGVLACMSIMLPLSAAVLGARPSGQPESVFAIVVSLAFFAWLFLGRSIACLLVPLLVSTLSCPGCDEEIDAVGVWHCSCGFRDHRERHILAAHCPLCGKAAGHIDCPRCGCTILFW